MVILNQSRSFNWMTKNQIFVFIQLASYIFFIVAMYTQGKLFQQQMFAYVFGKYVVPGMTKRLKPFKRDLFASLGSIVSSDPKLRPLGPGGIRILEIGVGSGTNLQYYPPNSRLVTVEPNQYFQTQFLENRKSFPNVTVENFVTAKAENMTDVEDDSIDVVVSTLVLCSVDNLEGVLKEIKRVLCPGGKFYYLEHVSYEEGTWGRWLQEAVEPIWKLASDGCRLTVPISTFIGEAGFETVDEKEIIMKEEFFVVRRNIVGVATKES